MKQKLNVEDFGATRLKVEKFYALNDCGTTILAWIAFPDIYMREVNFYLV